jgi:serine/threonine protein kinase
MTPESYNRAAAVFLAARKLPHAKRIPYLERECAAHELRAEVDALLACDDADGDATWGPGADLRGVLDGVLTDVPGGHPIRMGRYEVLGVLGQGGMGVVYRARQASPRRDVALKLIRAGLASTAALRRFRHEAEILSRLQHPGITTIFEAGAADTPAGPQPYFAMELVAGEPITTYADRCGLDVRRRLRLLTTVCEAVQHAHSKGVIHRDLKPSNILVSDAPSRAARRDAPRGSAADVDSSRLTTLNVGLLPRAPAAPQEDAPSVKIIDFGVARVAECDPLLTRQTAGGEVVGTLAYMSPEQACGDPDQIDGTADVYALGAIGYELLSGRLPLAVRWLSLPDALRSIREEVPARLGTLRPALRGDIEVIFAKALEKDRAQRYASPADLAGDIRRYLAHEPIIARPPSRLYQIGKFARRNRVLVGGVAATFVMLLAGVIATSWALVRATDERDRAVKAERTIERTLGEVAAARDRAEQEAAKAGSILDFLERMLASAEPSARRPADFKVRDLLDAAARRLDVELVDQPEVRAALLYTIGRAYLELGLAEPAIRHLRDSLSLRRVVLPPDSPDLADTLMFLAAGLGWRHGDIEEALTLIEEAVQIRELAFGPHHPHTVAAKELRARFWWQRGDADKTWNAIVDAWIALAPMLNPDDYPPYIADEIQQGQELAAAGAREALGERLWQFRMRAAETLRSHWSAGRRAEAQAYLRDHYGPLRRIPILSRTLPRMLVSAAAWLHSQDSDPDVVEPLLQEALAVSREVWGDEDTMTATILSRLAALMAENGRQEEGQAYADAAWEIQHRVLGDRHPDTAITLSVMAQLTEQAGRIDDAAAQYQQAIDILQAAGVAERPEAARARSGLGACRLRQGRLDEARRLTTEAYDRLRTIWGDTHPATRRAAQLCAELDHAR